MDLDQLAAQAAETEARSKSNTKRLDKLESRIDELDELTTSVALIAQDVGSVKSTMAEIKADVKELTAKPAKKWEDVSGKVLWLLIAAILGFVLAHLGM